MILTSFNNQFDASSYLRLHFKRNQTINDNYGNLVTISDNLLAASHVFATSGSLRGSDSVNAKGNLARSPAHTSDTLNGTITVMYQIRYIHTERKQECIPVGCVPAAR